VLGGISITGTTRELDLERLDEFVPDLRRTAQEIAAEAEAWVFPGAVQDQEPVAERAEQEGAGA
jgi:hypothetical protein